MFNLKKYLPLIPTMGLFWLLGFNVGTWASRLISIKENMLISDAYLGFFLLAASLGGVIAFPITIATIKYLGVRKAVIVQSIAASLLIYFIMNTQNYFLALFFMFLEGICCAGINTSINLFGNDMEKKHKIKFMARFHATFSLGLASAALLTMIVMKYISEALYVHSLISGLIILTIMILSVAKLPEIASEGNKENNDGSRLLNIKTLTLGGLILFATIVEGSMHDWSTIYLKDILHIEESIASSGLLVFSLSMFVGRLFADNFRSKYSDFILIFSAGLIVAFSLVTSLLIMNIAITWLAFSVVGLAISFVQPSIYAMAASMGTGSLSIVATFSSVGGFMGPPIVGFISSNSSLLYGMYFISFSSLCISFMAFFLLKLKQSNTLVNEGV
ncbi:MFS transporter [Vibrio sagamiensis]|uniref:MFS transporter n=1 Tax=Vibrio sagamiensis NBRC 104589 TaxID=1219064 RepID=A0A511QA19_9VIBR|nr:MFS transporter [Vibrio sagamiensis]PNQ62139.1 MFS transporter [Vibrio agarivorans]GEM74117.1 MFS transporter [Vibrio sagamiensis NBRC 104589]